MFTNGLFEEKELSNFFYQYAVNIAYCPANDWENQSLSDNNESFYEECVKVCEDPVKEMIMSLSGIGSFLAQIATVVAGIIGYKVSVFAAKLAYKRYWKRMDDIDKVDISPLQIAANFAKLDPRDVLTLAFLIQKLETMPPSLKQEKLDKCLEVLRIRGTAEQSGEHGLPPVSS